MKDLTGYLNLVFDKDKSIRFEGKLKTVSLSYRKNTPFVIL